MWVFLVAVAGVQVILFSQAYRRERSEKFLREQPWWLHQLAHTNHAILAGILIAEAFFAWRGKSYGDRYAFPGMFLFIAVASYYIGYAYNAVARRLKSKRIGKSSDLSTKSTTS